MKKLSFILLTILLSALMICACTGTPSSQTNGDTNDTSSQTSGDTSDTAGGSVGGNPNGDNTNVENSEDGENPQVYIATQVNNAYYKRIYGRYKGDDFPKEHGCYYKVIKTYEEFKEQFSSTDDVGRAFFNHYYAVIIYEHYETYNYSTFIGYTNFSAGKSVTAVYCDAADAAYPEGSSIKDAKACIAVPKSKLSNDNGEIKEIKVETKYMNDYDYSVNTISTEKASELSTGDVWLFKNNEELKAFCQPHGIYNKHIYGETYVLAFYSDVYCDDYIAFKDFYTDGKNVYITCEKVFAINPSTKSKPSIYFVTISKDIVEHEMSKNLVIHFLLEKAETTYIE